MPERFEIYIVYKMRYINTLPFLSFYTCAATHMHNDSVLCIAQLSSHKGGKLTMFYGIQNVLDQNLTNSSIRFLSFPYSLTYYLHYCQSQAMLNR